MSGEFLNVVYDRLGFFDRQLKVPVILHLLLGVRPPLFPVVLDDIRHERFLNLSHSGLPSKTRDYQLDQLQVIQRPHALEACEVGRLAGENVATIKWLEDLRRKA